MAIPILITEQYPKGLGKTVADIRMEMGSILPIEKVSFSCCSVVAFNNQLNHLRRSQILLAGIETHVCVLQTASDLIQEGYEVHVFKEKTRLGDWVEVDGKKGGDDLDHRDHRLSTIEGGWD